MCPPASPPSAGKGSLVQRELSPRGRLRDCPRLLDTLGIISAPFPAHFFATAPQTLRCAPLARVVAETFDSRVGGGLRPAPQGKASFCTNTRWFGTLPHRVGADLCVRPATPLRGTHPGAAT